MEGNLETALRRAACWAPRGMRTPAPSCSPAPRAGCASSPGARELYARLPSGEEVYVGLSTTNERVYITRTDGDYRVEASADLPSHLVEDVA